MGGSAFTSRSSTDQIKKSKCSTCTVLEDNSNYWVGSLFYQHPNGTLESVPQVGGMLVYYLQRYSYPGERLRAYPPGFRMIAGSPMKRTSDQSLESRAVSYACIDYNNPTAETGAFPQRNCPQGLRAQVFFPSCWDGVNLDSPDHKSHMAYPDQMNSGKCPPTHPVRMISIFFEVLWQTDKFASGWIDENGKPFRANPFIWSFGDNTGYGNHGDFLNGWDTDVLQAAVDECTDMSGVIELCSHFTFRSSDQANACLPEFLPAINEQVQGQMAQMPNIAAIPVAKFDPCGSSPTQGFDNTKPGQPIGACKGTFTNKTAYTPVDGAMSHNTPATGPDVPAPNPVDQNGYLGCWSDGANGRLLETQIPGNNWTSTTCRQAVRKLGPRFVVYGIQYGGECWASANATNYQAQGASNNCLKLCNADPWSYCGGPKTNQVYKVYNETEQPPTTNPIDQTGYLGCWTDNTNHLRTMEKQLSSTKWTPDTCRQAVKNLNGGYVIFGIQYGGECWFSTSATNYQSQGPSTKCTMACNADSTGSTICGGPSANQVYSVNA